MWKVRYVESEHQWAVYHTSREDDLGGIHWYSCELAHQMKDTLNILVDLGFDVSLQRRMFS